MQQSESLLQLAQTVTYFLEPLIPYIIAGTEKAAEEAGKNLGTDVWEKGKNLWNKISSKKSTNLEEAAINMSVFSTDAEVKQVFTQEVSKVLNDPDLYNEISSMMKSSVIQKIIATNYSVIENVKQKATNDVHQEIIANNSTIKSVEQTRDV